MKPIVRFPCHRSPHPALVPGDAAAAVRLAPSRHRRRAGATRSAAVLERRRDEERRSPTFVARVTTQGGPDFVPADQRIATFDNDGTLWIEQPMYVQLAFVLDRVKALAPHAPGLEDQAAVQGGARRRHEGAGRVRREGTGGAHGGDACRHDDGGVRQDRHRLARDRARSTLQAALHRAGLPADAGTARLSARQRLQDLHRRPAAASSSCGRGPRRSMAFRPSRSSAPRSRRGSRCRTAGRSLFRLPEINFIDDKAGKPIGINEHIGRRPIAAFGNSDGDLEMLQWTTMSGGVALRPDRPSHRRGTGICLRPQVALREARQGAGRRGGEQVDRGRHEERLEEDLRV